ncbi:YbjN domain-containing protein [Sphingobium sp. CFD-1]|uniref:YbjN domain-containing protein n=1 Tax=Sphingobium sp. CFD-1 TaxID=2878545 RepID=UPI00214CAA80|nr:YbjN domain-containing protein [Sphingobium sp. CFD-1]
MRHILTSLILTSLAIAAAAFSLPAFALDEEPCGKSMVCASNPQSVADGVQAAGYKAVLSKSSTTGNPMIESAANGYNYSIFFYECEDGKKCGSIQFQISFEDDGANTLELANKWNSNKRFSQMAVADDKSLAVSYDVATIGGLNQKNFADVVDWWALMLGELNKFFKENPAPAAAAEAAVK